jgi:hypothetical protein
MFIYYRKILNFRFLHKFYKNFDANRDFRVEPFQSTSGTLENLGLTFKAWEYGSVLFYRADLVNDVQVPRTDLDNVPDDTAFHFNVMLENPAFFNFTDLEAIDGSDSVRKKVFFFTSEGATTTIESITGQPDWTSVVELPAPKLLTLSNKRFIIPVEIAAPNTLAEVKVFNRNGQLVKRVSATLEETGTWPAVFDLTVYPDGEYSRQVYINGAPVGDPEAIFLSDEAAAKPPFGILELVKKSWWKDVQLVNEGESDNFCMDFNITFNPASVVWKYIIVFSKTALPAGDFTRYTIADLLLTEIAGDRYNTALPADQFFFSNPAETSFNGKNAISFFTATTLVNPVVEKKIPLYEEAKMDLVLRRDTSSILSGLPNPDVIRATNEIIIFI